MSLAERGPFLAWPGWAHLLRSWLLTFLVTVWFCFVFAGCDWFTAHREARMRVHLDVELQIPFIPAFTIVYLSIYFLFISAPFVLRTRREIGRLAIAQTLAISAAGVCFLLLPARLAFPQPADTALGIWKPLFNFADKLNLDYNLVPSLHVALSLVCIELFAPNAGPAGRTLLRVWGVLIAASTLLIHQHHVIDVAAGCLLAFAALKLTHQTAHRKKTAIH